MTADHPGTKRCDLPRRGKRTPFVGMIEHQSFRGRGVLCPFNQPFDGGFAWGQAPVQRTTSQRHDVRSRQKRFEGNASLGKRRFRPLFSVKNADDADDLAGGVLMNALNGDD